MTWRAWFSSRCGECDLRIDEDELVDWHEGEVVHASCLGARPVERTEAVCPKCHLTSCDCEDES